MYTAPVFALVGATGLVGSWLLPTLLNALDGGQIAELRILTSSPNSPKLSSLPDGVKVVKVSYADKAGLTEALRGAGVLVSAMGTSKSKEGEYDNSKAVLLDALVAAGVPSEFGTDHNSDAAKAIGSSMFAGKQAHHRKAESLGVSVISVYNSLFLEMSFSAWLGLDISVLNPTWSIPVPSHPVAFTSSRDIGRYVLSATLQTYHGATDIPSRLRISSDQLSLDECADIFEKHTGGKVVRKYLGAGELRERWEEAKPTLKSGMLGPAIPLMISQGGFDHTVNSNAVLRRAEFDFAPRSLDDFFEEVAVRKEWEK